MRIISSRVTGLAMRRACRIAECQACRRPIVTLTCEDEAEPLLLDLDSVTGLGIVIAEIVSNAYVYALPGRVGAIRVVLARGATGAVLTIGDYGVGFVEPYLGKRHGLGLVRRLMASDRGTE
jgi:two-component sensor histidine kinase